jgi:CDP-diacylglycerol--glycerol-3-phosphate 3-phosphatidyltransferase
MPLTLATRVTILRILFIPLFILLINYYDASVASGNPVIMWRWIATGLFLLEFILDALDGYLARSRGEITKLGTILDPLADKTMLLSALFLLMHPSGAFTSHLPPWFVLLVVSRDAMLIAGSLIIQSHAGHVIVRPRISGKATTFFQMLVILWILFGLSAHIFIIPLTCAALCTALSAIQYFLDGIHQLDKENNSAGFQ